LSKEKLSRDLNKPIGNCKSSKRNSLVRKKKSSYKISPRMRRRVRSRLFGKLRRNMDRRIGLEIWKRYLEQG
jgi:hypothetical protein